MRKEYYKMKYEKVLIELKKYIKNHLCYGLVCNDKVCFC